MDKSVKLNILHEGNPPMTHCGFSRRSGLLLFPRLNIPCRTAPTHPFANQAKWV